MLDSFSKRETFLSGSVLPSDRDQARLVECHERRLEAFHHLRKAAAQCGLGQSPATDYELLQFPEDDLSLLKHEGGAWAELYEAVRLLRLTLPLLTLEAFGFNSNADEPFDDNTQGLRCIGSGMEAWAFQDAAGSIYKFFLPREACWSGATFDFKQNSEDVIEAKACFECTYDDLLKKLLLINLIGGMPTEVLGLTSEGILIAKQTRGQALAKGTDPTPFLDLKILRDCPSRLLICDRAHPRLLVEKENLWLIGDLHDRNIVYDCNGQARIIDCVATQLPKKIIDRTPLLQHWLRLAIDNPVADLLEDVPDTEL